MARQDVGADFRRLMLQRSLIKVEVAQSLERIATDIGLAGIQMELMEVLSRFLTYEVEKLRGEAEDIQRKVEEDSERARRYG